MNINKSLRDWLKDIKKRGIKVRTIRSTNNHRIDYFMIEAHKEEEIPMDEVLCVVPLKRLKFKKSD